MIRTQSPIDIKLKLQENYPKTEDEKIIKDDKEIDY